MKFKFLLGLAFATMMTACTSTQKQADENPVLTIEGGQIQGVLTDSTNVMVYKGILMLLLLWVICVGNVLSLWWLGKV